uniref:DnaJ homolog subfamily C member 8 n=1 Tax=Xiphophorus maculatus TaxID=8083 RepID=A0A3B5RCN6_XIPMA
MAAAGGESSSQSVSDELFQNFYTEVKQIEKRDSVLTSKQQIDRLLRPGSSYFNLNPFEVLQIDPEATDEELKKRFRALSILVHPDKNQDDPDRSQKAFEVVDKSYKLLLDPEQKKRAVDVIQAGKEYVEHMVKQKKKQLKKDGKPQDVEEDDPDMFRQAVYKQTMKLFAELEIKRKEREAKDMHERKRAREEEIEAAEKAKREREWQKNFEESRDGRVDSWRTFQTKGKSKEKKNSRDCRRSGGASRQPVQTEALEGSEERVVLCGCRFPACRGVLLVGNSHNQDYNLLNKKMNKNSLFTLGRQWWLLK